MAIVGGINKNKCRVSGGIKDVYIVSTLDANWAPVVTNGLLTDIQTLGTVTLHKWELMAGSGSANESVTYDDSVGELTFNQSVELTAKTYSYTNMRTIESILKTSTTVMVHYNSGETRLFGYRFGMETSGAEFLSGEQLADGYQISVSLQGSELELAPLLENSSEVNPLGDLVDGVDYTLIEE